jgi:hypothetical protein
MPRYQRKPWKKPILYEQGVLPCPFGHLQPPVNLWQSPARYAWIQMVL